MRHMTNADGTFRIGVTGASGYLGSPLVKCLRNEGYDVIPISKTGTGPCVKVDVRDRTSVDAALAGSDLIVHLAGLSSVSLCEQRPTEAFEVNVNGTANIAWTCRTHEIPMMFASSVLAVENPGNRPVDSDSPCDPSNIYGLTKCMGEEDVNRLADGQFPAAIVRLSNAYGLTSLSAKSGGGDVPGTSVIHDFVLQAYRGEALTVHGNGSNAMDFVWLTDVLDAIRQLCSYLLENTGTGAETFTIGSGETWSIAEVAELVQEEAARRLGSRPEMRRVEPPSSGPEPVRLDVDITRVKAVTGFQPNYSLPEGIARMFSFIQA